MRGGEGSHSPFAGRPVRVALVDDSPLVRRMVRRILEAEADMEVVWEAGDGREAVARCTRPGAQPSAAVVLLDLQMPGLDGLGTLEELRRARCPIRVLVLSSLTRRGARATIEALARGAVDYICKPSATEVAAGGGFRTELLDKIRAWAGFGRDRRGTPSAAGNGSRHGRHPDRAASRPDTTPTSATGVAAIRRRRGAPPIAAVGIAASTGGPQALTELFAALPRPFPVPILVTQHMPEGFTAALADQLSRTTGHVCEEARSGAVPQAGRVHIAAGGRHLVVDPGSPPHLRLDDSPPVHFCRPAADPMFASMAEVWGAATMAVVLTGIGRDGADGAARIVACGGLALAQDEDSSVVWGMPGAVVRAGVATAVLPLDRIAPAIADIVKGERR